MSMEAGACSCDFDYDWVAEVHREETRTARKEHKCYECRAPILPGQKYVYVFQAGDGETFSAHFCLPCERIRRDFCAPYGMLRETLWDLLGFDYLEVPE